MPLIYNKQSAQKLTINIGLDNNPFKGVESHLPHYIASLLPVCGGQYKIRVGEYNGLPESTFIYTVMLNILEPQLARVLEVLCMALDQECIAYRYGHREKLVYNPFFKGYRNLFNSDYFLEG